MASARPGVPGALADAHQLGIFLQVTGLASMLRIARQTSYRSWRLGAAGFVLVFGAVCLYTALQGPKYRSEAKLYVRLGRESASLDPTALPGPSVASAESRALEINSVLEVLSSEELARQVVAQLGSDAVLGAAPSGRADAGGKLAFLNGVNLNPLRFVSREEQARRTVGERLHVGTAKNSNVVSLYYDARDPKSARDVLQALIGAAVELHLRVKQSQGCGELLQRAAHRVATTATGGRGSVAKLPPGNRAGRFRAGSGKSPWNGPRRSRGSFATMKWPMPPASGNWTPVVSWWRRCRTCP